MTRPRKAALSLSLLLTAIVLVCAYALFVIGASLSVLDGEWKIEGLGAPVEVQFDSFGIPRIEAQTREDAFRSLGFVTARERLFQMDLLRRKSAGKLAEVFGAPALQSDRWHRTMGFEQVAKAIIPRLTHAQQAVLRAYADGVNEAMAQIGTKPFEFLLLDYEPSAWRMEDSLLVVLGMYETLSWSGDAERSVTVMDKALPPPVTAFLTPDTDPYTDQLTGNDSARRPLLLPPEEDLRALGSFMDTKERLNKSVLPLLPPRASSSPPLPLGEGRGEGDNTIGERELDQRFHINLTAPPKISKGSNAWVVAPKKTRDGRAILANDMHLPLGAPNLWYRAELGYGKTQLAGLTLPGVPILISGSNHKVAWGFANTEGDVVDLVLLDIPPQNPTYYQTPDGPRPFEERRETIRVRDAVDVSLTVRSTIWGPVLDEPLLGHPIAVHWIALDPSATNLDLMELDEAATVEEAMGIFNRAGAPPQNVLIADAGGNIGWTLMGRIPARFNMDGLISHSWADGARGWRGYVEPEALPRILNPPSGFLVSANQRMVGGEYPHIIGHNYGNGYRAYRITEKLKEMRAITEQDMLALQLDIHAGFYEDYRRLALAALQSPEAAHDPEARRLRKYLEAWDGEANPDSLGLPLLMEFRNALMNAVISPLLTRCRAIDPAFKYAWRNSDSPLLKLLSSQRRELLPLSGHYPGWDTFIRAMLSQAAKRLSAHHSGNLLEDISWGEARKTHIRHPLSAAIPWLGWFLDMPDDPLPGCIQCVRAFSGRAGATERMVVSPGYEEEALLHMPGGQSGRPFSPHYRDQHSYWAKGWPMPLLAGPARHRLVLQP